MLEKRLEGYRDFINRPMPQWGVDLKSFDADDFKYLRQADRQAGRLWEELPDEIRATYDKLGIPEAEKAVLSPASRHSTNRVIYSTNPERILKTRRDFRRHRHRGASIRKSSRSISASAFRATTTNSRH